MNFKDKAEDALKTAEGGYEDAAGWAAVLWLRVIAYLILHYLSQRGLW